MSREELLLKIEMLFESPSEFLRELSDYLDLDDIGYDDLLDTFSNTRLVESFIFSKEREYLDEEDEDGFDFLY